MMRSAINQDIWGKLVAQRPDSEVVTVTSKTIKSKFPTLHQEKLNLTHFSSL